MKEILRSTTRGGDSMKIRWSSKGEYANVISLMKKYSNLPYNKRLSTIGKIYVNAIKANTPTRTGELASGFDYKVSKESDGPTMTITNYSHTEWPEIVSGLEYGHGTGTGGYVPGTHFVKKSIDSIESQVSKEIEGVITDVK